MKTKMKLKFYAAITACLFAGIVTLGLFGGLVGHNDDQNWQVLQSVTGNVTIIDDPGYYGKWFGTVWTYPRTLEGVYSMHPEEGGDKDSSIRTTFNDAGTAQVSSYTKVQLPTTADRRRKLHQDFQGNPNNILAALRAHLINCIKASAPVMSASENQASRKAEFNLIVEEQLSRGLFKMRRTQTELDDLTEIVDGGVDKNGNQITREKKAVVQATEIVNDADGAPIIIQPSPLKTYGIEIMQFSITAIEYDAATLTQFSAKKESYLNAEKSKAQRQEEVQSRLMIEEKGRRQVAEIEAEENQKKERALIQAAQAEEVAEIQKRQAVIEAKKRVEVAEQSRLEAEKLREISRIKVETAELEKEAVIASAEAKQKEIEIAGGITEKDRILAEIKAKRDVDVAVALSQVQSPGVVIAGGDGTHGSGDALSNLISLWLLKANGIIPNDTAIGNQPVR
jgi:hypothetical protein